MSSNANADLLTPEPKSCSLKSPRAKAAELKTPDNSGNIPVTPEVPRERSVRITPEVLRQQLASPAPPVLIDVRNCDEFERDRIAGARHFPLASVQAASEVFSEQCSAVLICESGVRATLAHESLTARGPAAARNIQILEGGMNAWRSANLPVAGNRPRVWSLERQVRLTAGIIAFAGSVLAATIHPAFLVVPGFIGAGLTFAAITNNCGLALVLAQMPWNRATTGGKTRGCATCACPMRKK